jgi:polysaccharide biosynthesis/export protein
MSYWRQFGAALMVGAASLGFAPPAMAQLESRMPQGSPLDPSMASSQMQPPSQTPVIMTSPFSAPTEARSASQLLEPKSINDLSGSTLSLDRLIAAQRPNGNEGSLWKPPAKPGEFEEYVTSLLGRRLPRFGQNMLLPSSRDFAAPSTATVPPDYIINPGDKIVISLAGSVEGSVEREVDTNGSVYLSGVGSIQVAGVRYGDLRDRISAAIGRQYRGYSVSVGIKELRGIRVYVTGFANNPGAFTISSLSTMANAVLQAGGPSGGGSFRSVKLYRNGQEVADFDLYELLRGGNRINDAVLQNEDVLFIPPAGQQVAVIGSVHEAAIYEARQGESIEQMLAAAGGPNTLGDPSRVILYRTGDPSQPGPREVMRAQAAETVVQAGDILQILSRGSLTQPIDRQSVLVRVEGEVNRPGIYYVAPNTPTSQILELAGGLTPRAFAYGTKFTRQSVRLQQQDSFKEAIKQLELTLAAAPLTADRSQSESERSAQVAGAKAVLDRLKDAEPDGRLVLNISPDAQTLPSNILLENNDSIYVPPRSSTVGVFGAVYRPASFLIGEGKPLKVRDYIEQAGGTVRSADRDGMFVVRANGEVLSKRKGAWSAHVLPGDVVFVPIKTQTGTFWSKFKDITTTLFQLGLSTATVVSVVDNN